MKLTIIGCWGGYPKMNEASSGYLLEHEGFNLLVDCGSGVLSKMQEYIQPEQLDAVILSHYHPDHNADIGVLQHARLIQGFLGKDMPELPIYAHDGDGTEFKKLTYKNITKGIKYNPNQPLTVGPFKITFMETVHPVLCYAMRIEAGGKMLVYTADTAYKDELAGFSQGADLLVAECNFYGDQDGRNAGHMNSFDGGKLANNANAGHLVLTHLPHYGKLEMLIEEAGQVFKGPISLAKTGECLHI
ncbi:MBL fold metallo-hydrolase [Cytobacillus gottheilii]|uniref:MBL fold metallo-hydrolase n=1 Tax=Cytobacillus gottheilii TaxID=859144 RepID=A0ABX8FFK2_9BACI|nr:MBL fold metallo-hydrolase [Cytobacillus gottheilii]QVY62808.1 MBL fold metallo-hydrolase [Cytobacillus gottheilii]